MLKLIKLYFLNTLKLNYFRIGDKKAKTWGFAALMVFVAASLLFTAGQYAYMVASVGLYELILPIFMAASSIVTLISTLFSSKSILFGYKDYDMQASLPVKHSSVIASRLFILYFYEILITAVIMVPAAYVYTLFARVQAVFYVAFILSLFFIPLLPLTIGGIIGAVVAVISSKVRKSSLLQVILMTVITLGIMALSLSSSAMGISSDIISAIYNSISRRWPPVIIYSNALDGNILSLALFIALSLLLFIIFSLIAGRFYNRINTAVTAVYTKGNYKVKAQKVRGLMKTMIYKEFKAYFGSFLWVFNTIFGMVILLIGAVASLFFGSSVLQALGGAEEMMLPILPLIISLMVCLTNVSCCSISMENGKLWLIKSLPVSGRSLMLSKMAVNFLVTAPVVIISSVLLCIGLKPDLITGLYMFLTPLAFCLFVAPFGLAVNLLLPKQEWTSDAQVVKQSAAVMVAVFGGMVCAGIPVALSISFGAKLVLPITTAVAAALGLALIYWINRGGLRKFRHID